MRDLKYVPPVSQNTPMAAIRNSRLAIPGMSLRRFAKRVGCSPAMMSRWERECAPSLAWWRVIAQKLRDYGGEEPWEWMKKHASPRLLWSMTDACDDLADVMRECVDLTPEQMQRVRKYARKVARKVANG